MMEDKNREYSISVICVYNDKQRMNEQLKKTLSDQACTYDFVPVNNVNNQFKSAAEALNFGALKAKGDILRIKILFLRHKTNFPYLLNI